VTPLQILSEKLDYMKASAQLKLIWGSQQKSTSLQAGLKWPEIKDTDPLNSAARPL